MISQTDENKSKSAQWYQEIDVDMLCQAFNDLGVFTLMKDTKCSKLFDFQN